MKHDKFALGSLVVDSSELIGCLVAMGCKFASMAKYIALNVQHHKRMKELITMQWE